MRSVSCKAGCVQKQPNSQPAVHSAKRCAPTAGDLRSVPVETPAAHECEKKETLERESASALPSRWEKFTRRGLSPGGQQRCAPRRRRCKSVHERSFFLRVLPRATMRSRMLCKRRRPTSSSTRRPSTRAVADVHKKENTEKKR